MIPDEHTQRRWRPPARLLVLSIVIGAAAGLGAVVFRGLIGFFHNLFFLGTTSWVYDANHHTPPSPLGAWIILLPVAVSLVVTFLVEHFAPEAKGHGVPEVIDAIYYQNGKIRPIVAVVKSLASALSIGSGGSVGREGPIIQIGSALSSAVGELLELSVWERITLIAAGAGGGIAATFNTPLGGVLFAVEIIMHEVSVRTLVPVALATAVATYVGRLFFGPKPSFVIPQLASFSTTVTDPLLIPAYAGLGLLVGLISIVYIRSIYVAEDLFERWFANPYLRHAVGMLGVGLCMFGWLRATGHYAVAGIGYAVIQDILTGAQAGIAVLLLLFVFKLLATSLTLGSGASGGIFSPALFLGATIGAACGELLGWLFPGAGVHPLAFAIAGMAASVGSATGAAITAIVMIFEMTLDYTLILPITASVALAYGVRAHWQKESIYTLKLARRGHVVPDSLRSDVHLNRPAREAMTEEVVALPARVPAAELRRRLEARPNTKFVVVCEGDDIVGVVPRDRLPDPEKTTASEIELGSLCAREWVDVRSDTIITAILLRLRFRSARYALVRRTNAPLSRDNLAGVISLEQIAQAISRKLDMFLET